MSWPMVPIKTVGKVVTGKTPSKLIPEYFGGNILFVTPTELDKDVYVKKSVQTLTDVGAAQIKLVPQNAVMVCCIGSLGKIGIAGSSLATNQQINSIIFDENKVDPKYGYYACSRLKPVLESLAPATTIAIVNKSLFESLEIPVPPLPDQKRIATILDKADSLRRKNQQAIELADKFLRAVFLDMFGDPVTNPKGWPIEKVGAVTDCIVPGRDKPKSFTGETPWVTTNDVIPLGVTCEPKVFIGLTENEILEVKSKVVPKDSVLMTCVGDLGILSISGMDIVINQQLHAFLPSPKVNNVFLMYALSFQKSYMLRMASNTTVPYMNKSICNSVPVILPQIDLQIKFKKIYESTKNHLYKFEIGRNYSQFLFNSISQKAFSGNL